MSFEFVFQYPAWFILLCILLGVVYAWVLYRKNKYLSEEKPRLIRLLSGLRALAVSIIAFLLLSPLLKFITREVEKPVIIVLQDNSESLVSGRDTAFYRNEYPRLVEQFRKNLQEQFDIKTYTFSDHLSDSFSLDYSGKETDIAAALDAVNTIYLNRNVGAVIVASDGIYNKGISPLYTVNELKAPFYTVALGDTTVKSDLLVAQVNHNQLAYLNNMFPVEVVVDARKLEGRQSVLKIWQDGRELASQSVPVSGNKYVQTFSFQFKAERPGVQRYRASLAPVEGEFTTVNNQRDFFIEVIDSRQKVLVLAEAPDPDIAALRLSLQQSDNYEVEVKLAGDFTGSVKPYSLVILHQLPGKTNAVANVLAELDANNIPALFIVGPATSLGTLNTAQSVMQFNGMRGTTNEVQPRLNKDFGLFTLSDELRKALQSYEPLIVPYANYRTLPSASVMLRQKIGTVETDYPLLAFNTVGDRKIGVLLGEGIWRWRLQNYAARQHHEQFDELVSKLVQYLSVRAERRNFRLITKNAFYENEPVTFEAEVYNASYELINTPDVLINIYDEQDHRYPFAFSRTANAYRLDAGRFREGDYRYEASVNVGEKSYTANGRFVVKPVVVETINTTADHALLHTLATRNGGEMVQPADLLSLAGKLKSRDDIKPVSHSDTRLKELIHLEWIFFLVLALLGAEWLLRKRNGAY